MGAGARRVFLLNETATLVWQALREPASPESLGDLLSKTYAVAPARARRDALDLVHRFRRQGLIEEVKT